MIRYLRVHPLIRAGLAVTLCGIYNASANGVVSVILGQPWYVPPHNLLISVYLLAAGLSLAVGGFLREKFRR